MIQQTDMALGQQFSAAGSQNIAYYIENLIFE